MSDTVKLDLPAVKAAAEAFGRTKDESGDYVALQHAITAYLSALTTEPASAAAEPVACKHVAPWSYDEREGDYLDAGGHMIGLHDDDVVAFVLAKVNALPNPPAVTEAPEADNLRTIVPGFRFDWSGLRNRFEDIAAHLNILDTYETRSAYLDELARDFEDAVTRALQSRAAL